MDRYIVMMIKDKNADLAGTDLFKRKYFGEKKGVEHGKIFRKNSQKIIKRLHWRYDSCIIILIDTRTSGPREAVL